MYESRSPFSAIAPVLAIGLTAVFFSAYNAVEVTQKERDKADERVERVQEYNAQLMPQIMEVRPGVMGTVTLKDRDETFSFSVREDGQTQTCRGEYEVTDEVATVAGPITCTQTTTTAK